MHLRGYDIAQLDQLYTGHDARARLIWNKVCRLVTDPSRMRALAFCVGVKHAVFMAEFFANAGMAAVAVLGTSSPGERKQAIQRLGSGELQVICTVDVFNEGVDIPEVDTVPAAAADGERDGVSAADRARFAPGGRQRLSDNSGLHRAGELALSL